MASLIPFLSPPLKDGSFRVKIKLHHNNQRKIISTEILVTHEDVTKKGKIKNNGIEMEVQNVLQVYRSKIQNLGIRIASMNVDEVFNYLTISPIKEIDFIKFAESLITNYKNENKPGMARNYTAAIRSLKAFTGRDTININELTSRFFFDYAKHMKTAMSRSHTVNVKPVGTRAISLYTGIFRSILNKAKAEYNDEDSEIINIRVNPFKKFKVPVDEPTSYRSISNEQIIAIRDYSPPLSLKREILARDCFMLSFYMCGINSVDLYNAPKFVDGRLTYNRTKTSGRRKDQAEISIKIEPEAKEIIDRYLNNDQLTFSKLYSSPDIFNRAINNGLKMIGVSIGVPELSFYSARHSWATIANNDCEIDKYTVHLALNHVDEEMKITDRYIRKDWSIIDKANSKVLDFIFSYRSLSKESIIQIRDFIPDDNSSKLILARDVFMLTFYLCGINSNDLFNNLIVDNGRIISNRQKSTTIINDQTFFNLNIEPEAQIILNKYSKNKELTFSSLYPSADTFHQSINEALKTFGKKIGITDLSLLSARQSWATIAHKDCSINKYTVHLALHANEKMKNTDRYIRKDWSIIDKANRSVLDFIIS